MIELLINCALLILAVVLGGMIVVFLEKNKKQTLIKLTLAFSGGFLLCMAFTHFIPELYHNSNSMVVGIWMLCGFLLQLILEFFSGGIEHGHIHIHKSEKTKSKIPMGMFISLSFHSLVEGIPLADSGAAHAHDHEHLVGDHQYSLLIGIILHQIPVAIAFMTLLRLSGNSKRRSWFFLLLFGIMTPFGMFLGHILEGGFITNYIQMILALVIGMFLHISTTIIFETSENHRFNLAKITAILLGVGLSLSLM